MFNFKQIGSRQNSLTQVQTFARSGQHAESGSADSPKSSSSSSSSCLRKKRKEKRRKRSSSSLENDTTTRDDLVILTHQYSTSPLCPRWRGIHISESGTSSRRSTHRHILTENVHRGCRDKRLPTERDGHVPRSNHLGEMERGLGVRII